MRLISEIKLAINNIYSRLSERATKLSHASTASSGVPSNGAAMPQAASGSSSAAQGGSQANNSTASVKIAKENAPQLLSQRVSATRPSQSRNAQVASAESAAAAAAAGGGGSHHVQTASMQTTTNSIQPTNVGMQAAIMAVKEPTLQEKLSAISDRIIDLSHIHAKVESLMRDERNRRKCSRPLPNSNAGIVASQNANRPSSPPT